MEFCLAEARLAVCRRLNAVLAEALCLIAETSTVLQVGRLGAVWRRRMASWHPSLVRYTRFKPVSWEERQITNVKKYLKATCRTPGIFANLVIIKAISEIFFINKQIQYRSYT